MREFEIVSLMQVRDGECWSCLRIGMFLFGSDCVTYGDKICPRGNASFLWSGVLCCDCCPVVMWREERILKRRCESGSAAFVGFDGSSGMSVGNMNEKLWR